MTQAALFPGMARAKHIFGRPGRPAREEQKCAVCGQPTRQLVWYTAQLAKSVTGWKAEFVCEPDRVWATIHFGLFL